MIVTDIIENDGSQFKRTYSNDETKMLHKVGTEEYYYEAIDVIDSAYEYAEVDRPIEEPVEENTEVE